MRAPVIRTENVGKCYQIYEKPLDRLKQSLWRGRKQFYREFWALRNISFEAKQGETLGIIGANGSGKSTLLQLICNILTPNEGKLETRGRIAALLELGAGFNPEFTGRENVFMNAAIMGLRREEIHARYDEIVRFADIGHFIDQPVKTYSSGMYVRLAFATATNVSPDILVVDEALAVGDARFRQKCMAKIKAFCQSGTVIFVSHDTAAVTELCSRVIWIESGKIKMDGLPKFVTEKYLEYMYEGDAGDKPAASAVSPIQTTQLDMKGFFVIGDNIRQFGNLKAVIKAVRMLSGGNNSGAVYTGQPCEISMVLEVYEDIPNPIFGYIVKDWLGRELLGDNTALMKQAVPKLLKGQQYLMSFEIEEWPNFYENDYSLTVAVADGTLADHKQCHYLHEAMIFKSVPFRVPGAVFCIPNTKISLHPV
jgi:lipopolysaccharide transport system ATP-binding protein